MSEQALDLRRSMQIVRRHKIVVGIAALLGLAGGVALVALSPSTLTSSAEVVLPTTANLALEAERHTMMEKVQVVLESLPPDQQRSIELAFLRDSAMRKLLREQALLSAL